MIVVNARFLTQEITGVQRFAIELSKKLVQQKELNLLFVAPPNVLHKQLAQELNVKIIGKAKGHIWEQYDLPKFLGRQQNPLLLCLANTAPLAYKHKVVTIHDLAFLHEPSWFSWKFRILYGFLVPRIARNAQHVLTVSEFSKAEISQKFAVPADKITVIYNAADNRFAVSGVSPALKKKPYVLSVGSLDPRKNLKNVLKAHQYLQDMDVGLKIVGGANKSFRDLGINTLQESVEILGRVSDEELISLYGAAEMFVYPSLYEGFGLPPLEAMKAGIPVVTSDLPVFREVCQEAALYVEPEDSKAIGGAIRKILLDSELRANMILAGKRVSNLYTWKASAEKLTTLLLKC